MVHPAPLAPLSDGRDGATGRFALGWRGGTGNPRAAAVGRLRSALLAAVTEDDIAAAVGALIAKARTGDVAAIRELLDRVCGKSTLPITVDAGEHVALEIPTPKLRGESPDPRREYRSLCAPDEATAALISQWNPGVKIIVGVNGAHL